MLDMKFLRENPDLVRENIKKKFQDEKLPLVDEVIELDAKNRAAITEASELRASRNALSKQIGMLMGQAKKDPSKLEEAEKIKATVKANADRLAELEKLEEEYEQKIHKIMLLIPNIIDPSVPIGPDDSCNVEVERFGEPKVPDFEIPYHTQIMESFDGVDMDAAGRVSGAGFYYLLGDIARLHEGVLAYARDFMIDKGFTFCIPPFMIHGNVVEGVMSQNDMDAVLPSFRVPPTAVWNGCPFSQIPYPETQERSESPPPIRRRSGIQYCFFCTSQNILCHGRAKEY